MRNGRRARSARRPPTKLPMARPPMKAASTVLMAKTVTPKASPSRRTQATWYTSPAAPDRNSSAATAATAPRFARPARAAIAVARASEQKRSRGPIRHPQAHEPRHLIRRGDRPQQQHRASSCVAIRTCARPPHRQSRRRPQRSTAAGVGWSDTPPSGARNLLAIAESTRCWREREYVGRSSVRAGVDVFRAWSAGSGGFGRSVGGRDDDRRRAAVERSQAHHQVADLLAGQAFEQLGHLGHHLGHFASQLARAA